MLDLKFVRENLDLIKKNVADRFMTVDVDLVAQLYDRRSELHQQIDSYRRQRNENASRMKAKLDDDVRRRLIEEGRELKERIASLEAELSENEKRLYGEAARIPNLAHPEAPVGKEEKDNTELRRNGSIPVFPFKARDHVEIASRLDLIDFDTATRVSGTKFYYLKNQAVLLELGLVRYAMDRAKEKGYTLTATPDIAKEEIAWGIGFNPRGEESNIYAIEGTGTCLIGTAEITLGGYYADQLLDATTLPIRMAGLSHCFRQEAGAAGQYSKGLYRVHQFTKVELFVVCRPEDSDRMHEELIALEEEIFSGLGIAYRVVDTCTGDLGAPAYRKFDIEAWMPGRGDAGDWGEVTSTSNCTDYQARRLKVRYKEGAKTVFVHMLNGTAIAVSRALVAILENYQESDGSVRMPPALVPYLGFERIAALT